MMRTDARAPTIRLADYRPPAFLAESVELTFALDPAATRVRARVSLPPQPRARRRAGRSTCGSTAAASGSSRPRSTARRCRRTPSPSTTRA